MTEYGKSQKLKDITVCHMHTEGPAAYTDPSCEGIFRSFSFFMGGNVRKAVADGRGDCLPIFLSEIPLLFYKKIFQPDIALIHVSPPDDHGYCSLGTSIDCVRAALTNSKTIIAQVNPQMPRTFGDGIIHVSHIDIGRIVGSFLIGTQKLYDFVDNNPFIEMLAIDYVNNTGIVAQQPRMTAINSCIEVDLTGQVVSDSIGTRMYSGFGGQVDFIRGAAEGRDGLGKPIIALPSSTNKGESKISPFIKQGAGVVTTRAHVHYVVTEYGIAYLFGKSLRQRAYALIHIAHPNHRESLEKAAFERLKVMPSA
ncbi:uncharacterized protein BDFB_006312, partial [Asbolus verrucosus]